MILYFAGNYHFSVGLIVCLAFIRTVNTFAVPVNCMDKINLDNTEWNKINATAECIGLTQVTSIVAL